jgi:hypothetical protein
MLANTAYNYYSIKTKNEKNFLKSIIKANVLINKQKIRQIFKKKSIRLQIIPNIIFQCFGIPKKKKRKNTSFILSITDGVALLDLLKKSI